MKYLNHTALIFLMLFAAGAINTTWSQVEAIVKGKVVSENGAPIKNASVKLGNTDARTNSSGIFIAKTASFPAKLTVSHSLFVEHSDMVVLPERWKDTIRVFVVMTGKEKELEEVTVSAEKIFWVYPRKQANVLDFILQPDNGILLCCSDEKNYFMRRLDSQGEKINETSIRSHPKKLYKDCMEKVHLVYSDSIYETVLVNNSIGIFQPKAVMGIFNLLKSCVYKDDKNLVKYTYSKQDQCIEYSAINILNKRTQILYVGEDRARNRELREYGAEKANAEDQLFHTVPPPPPPSNPNPLPSHLPDSPGDLGILQKAREKWDNKKFYDLILIKPTYIPMFELNDSLIIFDHLNDSAVVFTKAGVRVRSFQIYYHYFPGWKNELITNLEKTKIYARYEKEGLTILRELNPTNGKTQRIINLEKHVFPEHIQINDDFIYYIYKDYLDQNMHYLYKQHIE
jgi:hypothetical protein